ncbi:MAG: DUF882 domain-containing protein [Deltaproteobacteria bacterium]|jgi:hypothetical protein|nr:DUF882 domain-containing protein [Deltaproteobacteria bacterium]
MITGLLVWVALATPWSSAEPPMVLAAAPVQVEPTADVDISDDDLHLQEIFDPDVELGQQVTIYARNLRQRVTVRLPSDPNEVTDETMAAMRRILRCHRTGRRHRIDKNVVAHLGRVAARFPGREIEIVSGYRAYGGAKRSKHFRGQAVDFKVEGVRAKEVRDFLWAELEHVGVGHYHSKGFIHLDVRPSEMKIGWDQWREGGKYRYHPRWTAGNGNI